MNRKSKQAITVKVNIEAPIEKVWKCWTTPEDIIQWNFASDDWCSPRAENNLIVGGEFNYRMEAKDGSFGFDFVGKYSAIIKNKQIDYVLGDNRKVQIIFSAKTNKTEIIETFEAEETNPTEMQQFGWQAILINFKKHVESK